MKSNEDPKNELVGRALFDNSQVERPSPCTVRELIKAGVDRADINRAAESRNYPDTVMGKFEDQLTQMMPIYKQLTEALADYCIHSNRTPLFAGRDAEVLWDIYNTWLPDSQAHLVPASQPLMSHLFHSIIFDDDGLYDVRHFYSRYMGINYEDLNSGRQYVVVDSGFSGSIAKMIRLIATRVCPAPPQDKGYAGAIESRLVCSLGRSVVQVIPDLSAKYATYATEQDRATIAWLDGDMGSSDPVAFVVASNMQRMPRYHGAYQSYDHRRGLRTEAQSEIPDLDKAMAKDSTVNASFVAPAAAAVSQYRVVKCALDASNPAR